MGLLAVALVRIGIVQAATNFTAVVGAVNIAMATFEASCRIQKEIAERKKAKDPS